MPIKEITITQWADHHECRDHLPILIRRLIRETTPSILSLRFPGNEAVDLAGPDGQVESESSTAMVPQGRSIWEMGCNQNPSEKADSDYIKRTAGIPEVERKAASFIFVTPRRWNKKENWLEERRREKSWANVHAYDAIDLETWLEEAPVTSRWLGELLGLACPSLLTPQEWWNRWATVTDPPLATSLVTIRRHDERQTLLERLRKEESVIPVMADDRQEAAAFVVATLLESNAVDLSDRTLVATSASARITSNPTHLLIIADVPAGVDLDFGDRRKITVVRPYQKGRFEVDNALHISHVSTEAFRSGLESMGFSQDEAARNALQTGHSVPVLRRLLSRDPEIRRPVWARNRTSVKRLLPFALAGAWVEESSFDDSSILELLGEVDAETLKRNRDDLLALDDAPIAKYGRVTKVVSQLDAFFAVGPFIERNDLERFFQLVPELLGERDPALDLPQEQWWMAQVLGKSPSCSKELFSGFGDALCILAMHGGIICGDRLGVNCAHRVGLVVRSLMHNANEDRWLTIRRHLRALAEASPEEFLTCLEEELLQPNPPIRAIMGTTNGGISGECLRTDLLWALEMLAWHPEYFSRVAQIIFGLCRFETKDNWTNTPKSTAQSLFRVWLPGTTLGIDARMVVLRDLAERFRKPILDVCISLLPQYMGQLAIKNLRPEWRTLKVEVPVPTHGDVMLAATEASRLILDLCPFDKSELKVVLKAATRLHSNDLIRLVEEVQRWAVNADDEEKAELRRDVRLNVVERVYNDKNDINQAMAFSQIESALEPIELTARHRWLFDSHYIDWRVLNEGKDEDQISFEECAAHVQQRRQDAIAEIAHYQGKEQALRFALAVKFPGLVAQALVQPDTDSSNIAEWISLVLAEAPSTAADAFLQQVLLTSAWNNLPAVVTVLNERLVLDTLDKRYRFVKALPGIPSGWQVAEAMGEELAAIYWNTASLSIWDDTPIDEVRFGIKKLLEAKRPRSAFLAVHALPDRISPDMWVHILQGIAQGDEPEGQLPSAHSIDDILQCVEKSRRIPEDQLVQLEFPFISALCSGGQTVFGRSLAVHRELSRNPESFVQLLTWLYQPKDRANELDVEYTAEQQRNLANIAFHALASWGILPGCQEDGNVDREKFVTWMGQALQRATEVDRRGVAESQLGRLLGRFARHRTRDQWLPDSVLGFLDMPENSDLLKQLDLGVHSARGVTRRSPFDGGAQERALAGKYRDLAAKYGTIYPRVSAQLIVIAESYEHDARQHDEEAAIDERWHP